MQNKTLSEFSDIGLLQVTQCTLISPLLWLIFLCFYLKTLKGEHPTRKYNLTH